MSSSVNPSESASASRKSKPGPRERAAKRSAAGQSHGQPASAVKAAAFSAGGQVPAPTPGKFPVVFQTGAGEPSRDDNFSVDGDVLASNLRKYPRMYTFSPKYAEFKAHQELTDAEFGSQIIFSALLRLAQQLCHSHINMGLPLGDFSPISSSDVRVPQAISAYLMQFGEFSVPSLGTRFLLSGYEETITKLVYMASEVHASRIAALDRFWLPQRQGDRTTKLFLAEKLRTFLLRYGVSYERAALEEAVLSGSEPMAYEDFKSIIGDDDGTAPTQKDRFDFLFKQYGDVGQFTTAFTTPDAAAALREIGVTWNAPSASHMNWQFNVKAEFTRLADIWARLAAAYGQFFEVSSGVPNKASAVGSLAQFVRVTEVESVFVLKTRLAMSAGEFSLSISFPPSCFFRGEGSSNVVMTTPLSVSQRATEFCLQDWR